MTKVFTFPFKGAKFVNGFAASVVKGGEDDDTPYKEYVNKDVPDYNVPKTCRYLAAVLLAAVVGSIIVALVG